MAGEHEEHPGTGAPRKLRARSPTEVHLYLDLHPCECGHARPRDRQELRSGCNGAFVIFYGGDCPGCGRPWRAAFSVPDGLPPDGSIGEGTSAIICPGEFVWLSDREAAFPAGSPGAHTARERLSLAAAALDEAAKFIPPGGDRVPPEAFTSGAGRALHAEFPGRFLREDLNGRAELYRAGAFQAR